MFIRASTLAKRLGLHRDTVESWNQLQKPPVHYIGRAQHFVLTEVDDWLASLPRTPGFKELITFAKLKSGELRLMNSHDILSVLLPNGSLTRQRSMLKNLYHHGSLEYVTAGGARLFSLAHIEEVVAAQARAMEDFEYNRLRHLVGAPYNTVIRAVQHGDLVSIPRPENPKYRRITRVSLLHLLRDLLPRSSETGGLLVRPEAWIESREISGLPLLNVSEAADRLGVPPEDLRALLMAGDIQYIKSLGGKNFLVSPSSLARYQLRQPPLSDTQKAAVFGVDVASLRQWIDQGLIMCPLHNHFFESDMHRWCLVAFLRPLCGANVDAVRWVRLCLNRGQGSEVWPESEAAAFLRRTLDEMRVGAKDGTFPAIRTPDGAWMYRASAIRWSRQRAR